MAHKFPRLYFAYGSNLHLDQMRRRCPKAKPVGRMTLPNFRLTFRGVADIEELEGCSVEGALFEVTADCLKALDRYEGYPTLYTRGTFEILLHGERREVFTYYMMDDENIWPPSDEYFQCIKEGYQHWELPLESLEAAKALSYLDKQGLPRGKALTQLRSKKKKTKVEREALARHDKQRKAKKLLYARTTPDDRSVFEAWWEENQREAKATGAASRYNAFLQRHRGS